MRSYFTFSSLCSQAKLIHVSCSFYFHHKSRAPYSVTCKTFLN